MQTVISCCLSFLALFIAIFSSLTWNNDMSVQKCYNPVSGRFSPNSVLPVNHFSKQHHSSFKVFPFYPILFWMSDKWPIVYEKSKVLKNQWLFVKYWGQNVEISEKSTPAHSLLLFQKMKNMSSISALSNQFWQT